MYSFYGGRPGNPFVIVKAFESVAAMVQNFQQGPNYTAVRYDEHVIINTENKNNPENGKIYKRGYDFTNEMGGAEYIGTIVGPAGGAPSLEMATVAQIQTKTAEQGYIERYASGQYTLENDSLIPGKNNDGTFNDDIFWASYSIKDVNGDDSTAYIGFTFPYTIIEFEARAVEPYRNGTYADTSAATRIDDGTHPFFEKWRIDIPKGIQGTSFKDLKVETASSDIFPYIGRQDDVANNRKIFVYNWYDYSEDQDGDSMKMYLGDYNVIDNISIANDGTVTISYTHDDDAVFTKKLKWLANTSINTESSSGAGEGTGNQKIHIAWNDGTSEDIGNPINYIMSMAINDNNHLLVRYSDPNKRINGITWNNIDGWTDLGLTAVNRQVYQPGDYISDLNWIGVGELFVNTSDDPYLSVRFFIPLNKTIGSDVHTIEFPPDDDAGYFSGDNGTVSFNNLGFLGNEYYEGITPTGIEIWAETDIPANTGYGSRFINISISSMQFWFRSGQ